MEQGWTKRERGRTRRFVVHLPRGLDIVLDSNPPYHTPVVQRGQVRVPLPTPWKPISWTHGPGPPLQGLRECADGEIALVFRDVREGGGGAALTVRTSVDEMEGWIENARGMTLYRRRDFAQAAESFQRASVQAPTLDVARTNLASALTRLGRLDEAVNAIEPLLRCSRYRLYAQLCEDPDLRPLLEVPPIARLRASRGGDARIGAGPLPRYRSPMGLPPEKLVFHSASHGLLAVPYAVNSLGDDRDAVLVILDLEGNQHAELALKYQNDSPAQRRNRANVANRFLSDLGFTPYVDVEFGRPTELENYRFPGGRFALVAGADAVRLVRKDTVLDSRPSSGSEFEGALWLRSLRVVVYWWVVRTHVGDAGVGLVRVPEEP